MMGTIENKSYNFFRQIPIIADLINFIVFKGRQIILSKHVHLLNTKYHLVSVENTYFKDRDLLALILIPDQINPMKMVAFKVGLELYSFQNYEVPNTLNLYDALDYYLQGQEVDSSDNVNDMDHPERQNPNEVTADQADGQEKIGSYHHFLSRLGPESKYIPGINIVINQTHGLWKPPLTTNTQISDYSHYPEELANTFKQSQVIWPRFLFDPFVIPDEEVSKFQTDLRLYTLVVQNSMTVDSFEKVIQDNITEFEALDYNTFCAIDAAVKFSLNKYIKKHRKNGKVVVNVCQAIEQLKERERNFGRAEGRAEGRTEGIAEGIEKGRVEGEFKNLIANAATVMRRMGYSYLEALDFLSADGKLRLEAEQYFRSH